MTQDFKLNYTGMGEFLRGADMIKLMTERGEKVKAEAEATAPDYAPLGIGYKEDFKLIVDVRATGKGGERACATVINTSDHAIYVEFGGKNTPRHRTLGKALGVAK